MGTTRPPLTSGMHSRPKANWSGLAKGVAAEGDHLLGRRYWPDLPR